MTAPTIASTMNNSPAVAHALKMKKFMVMSSKGHAQGNLFLVYTDQARKSKVCVIRSKNEPIREIKLFAGIPFIDDNTHHQPGWFCIKSGESVYQTAQRFNEINQHVQIKEIWRRADTDINISYL